VFEGRAIRQSVATTTSSVRGGPSEVAASGPMRLGSRVMLSPVIQRIATWLCLVASVWMGLSPAQAFVLCLAPDGSVSLEVAVEGHCAGCPSSCLGHEVQLPSECSSCSHEDADGLPEPDQAALIAGADCSCVDIVLPSTDDDRVQARSGCPHAEAMVAVAPAADAIPVLWPPDVWLRLRVDPHERPPPNLALLRSVVLVI
jgi:hypothetical protein